MKFNSYAILFTLILTVIGFNIQGHGGPEWFYDKKNPYHEANTSLQDRKWAEAEEKYQSLLEREVGNEYDQNMARINLASCQMAQQKASSNWAAFDELCDIPPERRFSPANKAESLIIKTDKIGIGDIVHFLNVIPECQKREWAEHIILAIPGFLMNILSKTAEKYEIRLLKEDEIIWWEKSRKPHNITHLISLYGHLELDPSLLSPEAPLFMAQERIVEKIRRLIDLNQKKLTSGTKIVPVFIGVNEQATLMGGKQLPQDNDVHGRHLVAAAFQRLLDNRPTILVDCNQQKNCIKFSEKGTSYLTMLEKYKDKVLRLPKEEGVSQENGALDTIIALGLVVSQLKDNFVGFGADNGLTNVFTRALSRDAQERFAFIIPNNNEYDMRMEGEGDSYKQMISSCHVYKCPSPERQDETILKAYDEISGYSNYCSLQ